MGGSTFDPNAYTQRQTTRAATGQSAFAYTAQVQSGQAQAKAHADMNVLNVVRESRDSAAHPESVPVMVIFDVTGSMGEIPIVLQAKLGKLMEALIGNGYLDHPQLMFGAVGDSFSDKVPFQAGQFESGIELDDDLAKVFLEGNGGGNGGESYLLPYYFAAKHTSADAFEKRGKKGYLFTIGDEPIHRMISRSEAKNIFGDTIEADMTAEQVMELATEKFECFHLQVQRGRGYDATATAQWKKLLGERALLLDDPAAVTETIASTIGIIEGRLQVADVAADLTKAGFANNTAMSASRAVGVLVNQPRALTKATATGSLDIFSGNSGITKL